MELILYNGKIKTDDGDVSAVACDGGVFTAIGSDEDILALKTDDTKLVDLEGKRVLPGFDDSHQHFLDEGYSFRRLDLRPAKSIDDVIAMGKAFIKERNIAGDKWMEANNWNQEDWTEKRLPTRHDLDKISTEIPIAATRVCGHIVSVNSKALEIMGFTKDTPQPDDGSRFDLEEDGEPNGVLHELYHVVKDHIPYPSVADIKEMLKLVAAEASSKGLTRVQSDDLAVIPTRDFSDVIQAFMELTEEHALPVRVSEQCYRQDMKEMNEFYERGYHMGYGNDYYRMSCIKIVADGSLGGRTAWMLDDYSDEPGQKGLQIYKDNKEIFDMVECAHIHHMPVAVHCIGDAAATQVVDAIENAMKKHPDIKLRHGIVHAQTLNEDLCRRMKELDIQAFIQPVFIQSDMEMAEDRLGERIKYSYNWRTLADLGIHLSMGTDCPVEDMNPIANIYSAVTRKSIAHPELPAWHPEEALTLDEAIRFYTEASAYASGDEDRKGKIKKGYLADMTVLDRDIYAVPVEEIKDIKVAMTVVGGQITYSA